MSAPENRGYDAGDVVVSRVDYGFNAGQSAELEIDHAGHFVREDLEQVCRLVAEGVMKVGPIVQEIVPIAQAVSVYDRLRERPDSLFGTVFDWTGAHCGWQDEVGLVLA